MRGEAPPAPLVLHFVENILSVAPIAIQLAESRATACSWRDISGYRYPEPRSAATWVVGELVSSRHWKPMAAVLGVGVLLLNGQWNQAWPWHHNSDWRGAARKIQALGLDPGTPVICPSPFIEAKPPVWRPDYPLPGFLYAHLPVYPVPGKVWLFPFEDSPEGETVCPPALGEPIRPLWRTGASRLLDGLVRRAAGTRRRQPRALPDVRRCRGRGVSSGAGHRPAQIDIEVTQPLWSCAMCVSSVRAAPTRAATSIACATVKCVGCGPVAQRVDDERAGRRRAAATTRRGWRCSRSGTRTRRPGSRRSAAPRA